jgi:O-methyltransferase
MPDTQVTPAKLYLDLLKRTVTGAIYEDNDQILGGHTRGVGRLRHRLGNRVGDLAKAVGLEIVRTRPYSPELRERGLDRPARAHSMIGLRRMDNLQRCIESVLADGVPGDLIETGVWRGGATIFMRGVLKAHGETSRKVWVADSFEGLPKPNTSKYPVDAGDQFHLRADLRVGVEQVRHNFRLYDLLDDQVEFLIGWFKDTLPAAPIEKLAVLRLDGDMYESTMDALEPLYPKLSRDGYCIIDDYSLPRTRRAVEDYRHAQRITDEIIDIDGEAAYWRKASDAETAVPS